MKSQQSAARAALSTGLAVLLCAALSACGSNTSDLQNFVAKVKARKGLSIKPMPKVPTYLPYTYRPGGRRSPFTAPTPTKPSSKNSVHPNLNRPLEPLEHYPLDALKMVGTIITAGTTYAMIKTPDNIVHLIKPGEYMGQHYGRVGAISPAGLTLTEIVSNGNGGYTKRDAALSPSP